MVLWKAAYKMELIKLLSVMERLLKLVQNRPSSLDYSRQNEGIFDIQTYQKAIDRMSCSSSLDQIAHPHGKRLSLSETVNKYTNSSLFQGTHLHLKQQIRPHQARQIVSRITEIIKTKREASKFLSSEHSNSQRIHPNHSHEKKASYSAYISARKKIFEKQNPLPYSTNARSQPKEQTPKSLPLEEEGKEVFGSDCLKQQINSEIDSSLTYYMNNTMSKYQRIRLEGIVTKKKIEAKKTKETDTNPDPHNFQPRARLPRSFITVIKKRPNESHLIINSTKQVTSQRKIENAGDTVETYIKNFANQTRLQEDEIEIFPQVEFVAKLGKAAEGLNIAQEISCKAATVLHWKDEEIKPLFHQNEKEKLQIASITKTMTCYLILTIADRFGIDIKRQKLIISERASKMPGTSARLAYSDVLSVYDMLHGLMLPSGNDAAIALGEWGGKQIRKYSSLLRRMKIGEEGDKSSNFLATFTIKRKSHVRLFVHHMNKLAKFLHLGTTHFANTHGLMNEKAYSCSHNISLLTHYAMTHPTFREIVAKPTFACTIFNRTFSHSKQVQWENTNKLLAIEGFLGVKTGITPSAGPCLTSYFQLAPNEYFIVTILKTKSCEMRFKETISLLRATLVHLTSQSPNYLYKTALNNLESYNKTEFKDEKEQANNCRESTQSNQSMSEHDEQDFNDFKMELE